MIAKQVFVVAAVLLALAGCASGPLPYEIPKAAEGLPVAMVSMECDLNPEVNRRRMSAYVEQIMAQHPGVRLICFGETTLGWYWKVFGSAAYQKTVAEPIDGTTVSMMSSHARSYAVNILFGFTEYEDGTIYNSAVLIDHQGNLAAHRRKSDFVLMDRCNGFTAGQERVTTVSIDNTRAALLICNDFNNRDFQEQIKAEPAIKMLLLPHATANLEPDFYKRYRYNFKGLWLLSAQRHGSENGLDYYGSWILDPNGYMVACSDSGPGYFYYRVPIE
jgi:predicted amidohydrolase